MYLLLHTDVMCPQYSLSFSRALYYLINFEQKRKTGRFKKSLELSICELKEKIRNINIYNFV